MTIERLEREMVEKRHRLSQVELAAKEYSKSRDMDAATGVLLYVVVVKVKPG